MCYNVNNKDKESQSAIGSTSFITQRVEYFQALVYRTGDDQDDDDDDDDDDDNDDDDDEEREEEEVYEEEKKEGDEGNE